MAMVGHKTESIYRRYAIVDAKVLAEATFVHMFDVQGREALRSGMRVSFLQSSTEKGPRARCLVIVDEGPRGNQATQVEAV